ncbi:MAG TPA: hypothetical protein PK052_11495 [Anaerohalosphaeraceae bacterium]|nr:hypothetical protein [Anaerohalosphaeraceae bacterium]HOL32592.1 hypothetical protein [Anaerohalosphaeraceae bacterium]
MKKNRKYTEFQRWVDRLIADIDAYDKETIDRLMRSGLTYEEALEYLRRCR